MADSTKEAQSAFRRTCDELEAKGFAEFLDSPLTKLALSMMPAAEPPEMTRVILQTAFKAGMNTGIGACSSDLVRMLGDAIKKDK